MAKVTITIEDIPSANDVTIEVVSDPPLAQSKGNFTSAQDLANFLLACVEEASDAMDFVPRREELN